MGIAQQPDLLKIEAFISLHMVHWLHRRGQQLLLAKVKNADWQDWYIYERHISKAKYNKDMTMFFSSNIYPDQLTLLECRKTMLAD